MTRLLAYLTRPTHHRILFACDRPEFWDLSRGVCACRMEKK